MKIDAINSAMQAENCKPVRQTAIRKENPIEQQVPAFELPEEQEDVYTPSDPYTTEQKYDMAVRLAAYYKDQYDKLSEQGCCVA